MVETRAAPRYRVTKPALIEHGGEKMKCTVRDLWDQKDLGAAADGQTFTVAPHASLFLRISPGN